MSEIREYKFYCFGCSNQFYQECSLNDLNKFVNEYGEWLVTDCPYCGFNAKHVGQKPPVSIRTETLTGAGVNRQISSAMLKEIKSGTRTKDDHFVSGREGRSYQRSAGRL